MRYIATFDIGTTAIKGVLVSEEGEPIFSQSIEIETIFDGDKKEQKPDHWHQAFVEISKSFMLHYSKSDIIGIVMSGQMQDLIVLDHNNNPIDNGILYSDGRAEVEAKEIIDILGEDEILAYTGNNMNGSLPFAKLVWLKKNKPLIYNNTTKILFSSKDYVIAKLTNNCISDVTTCATTGLMDIHKKVWRKDWMKRLNLDSDKLPKLAYANEKVGVVTKAINGYEVGTPVYAGTGDAGATTLASGINQDGEFNINLGTSGWVACVSKDVLHNTGVFNLAAMQKDLYINVVPFLNAGNVHKWISKTLTPDHMQEEKYEYMSKLLEESGTGSNGVMFLPYIVGERFPVLDAEVKGCFIGITPETTKQDMARATLEGVAYSIRQGIESIDRTPQKISLIGGGARNKVWCQILADMLHHEVLVFNNSEYLPSRAVAVAAMIDLGMVADYKTFTDSLQSSDACVCYVPNEGASNYYNGVYEKYCRIYPKVSKL